MTQLEFYLIDTLPLTFILGGVLIRSNNTLPAILKKGMIVNLLSGKWPLDNRNDCSCQTFVFQKTDGSQFKMLVTGFTWNCTLPTKEQQIDIDNPAAPAIRVFGKLTGF